MPTSRHYRHLTSEDRAAIMIASRQHHSVRATSRTLGRSASTISRELERLGENTAYNANAAAQHYRQHRQCCRRQPVLVEGSRLYQYVHERLVYRFWSPQKIAARLRRMPESRRPGLVSHETIYATLYAQPHGSLKTALVPALRQARPKRGQRRTTAASRPGFVPEALRICHRPEEIAHRLLPGHWEGDFIKGAFNRSAVGVLLERQTRFVILCRMDGCTADDALAGFTRQMKRLPAFLRQSLTHDRGSEMACFRELSTRLNIDLWFCDPHAPWQRGSNENTHGLLRQILPRGMDLSPLRQTRLNDIARPLNGRPRATLDWQTPDEVMTQVLDNHARSRVALDS